MSDNNIFCRVSNFSRTQLLTDGAQVRLWSNAYGMNVRIQENGAVDGKGWSASYGEHFIVCAFHCVCMSA